MLAADFHSLSLHAIGRSIIGLHQVHHHDEAVAAVEKEEIDAFQNKVAHLFLDPAASNSHSSGEILSLPWLRSLLEVFVTCQDEFRILLMNNRSCLANQSLERLVGDFYERSVTALDVCNAVGDGIEQIREWKKVLEIVFEAIESGKWRRKNCQKKLGECQILRAKKALADLSFKMLQEDHNSFFPRNRSLGRINQSSKEQKSLRKTVSWSWSASKQIDTIGCNLLPPKGSDANTTHGMTAAVYTMDCVLYIVMWALVASMPCHHRGHHHHFSIPRHFLWAAPVLAIHDSMDWIIDHIVDQIRETRITREDGSQELYWTVGPLTYLVVKQEDAMEVDDEQTGKGKKLEVTELENSAQIELDEEGMPQEVTSGTKGKEKEATPPAAKKQKRSKGSGVKISG